ncbi:MAG: Gfo/Idh/MocA family protein [Longimicrobiales bacterium]
MRKVSRRDVVKASASVAAGLAASGWFPDRLAAAVHTERRGRQEPRLRFSVIGLNHGHIYGQTSATIDGGGELVSFYAVEDDLAAAFSRRFPQAERVSDERAILEDSSIQLVVSAPIPDERAPLGVRVMQHGKDYMSDKPGITTLEQLAEARRVQAETNRIHSIMYSERFGNRATVKAGELVQAGAIGDVIQTIGLGPHRTNPASRPAWFWDKARYGGIICDIGSHQLDQFLFFTGSTRAEVVASQIANFHHPEHPAFEDFGDVMVRGNGGTGYVRIDWFTPDGLPTWGDGRLTILGSEGYIELRKYVDVGGRDGGDHLFIVDGDGVRHIDCGDVELPYGGQLVDDILNRTETAMTQAHCFLAAELSLRAQAEAQQITQDSAPA